MVEGNDNIMLITIDKEAYNIIRKFWDLISRSAVTTEAYGPTFDVFCRNALIHGAHYISQEIIEYARMRGLTRI